MRGKLKRKLSQSEISQEINLAELFDRAPSETEARAFAEAAIERIIDRSQSGVDRTGNQFKQYTKEYAEEKGVSRGDVDMTLFGDMLLAIQPEISGGKVRLEISGEEAAKAYGHITGFRGHPTIPEGKYKRDFFGLTKDEAQQIAQSVRGADFFEPERIDISSILSNIGLMAEDDSGN